MLILTSVKYAGLTSKSLTAYHEFYTHVGMFQYFCCTLRAFFSFYIAINVFFCFPFQDTGSVLCYYICFLFIDAALFSSTLLQVAPYADLFLEFLRSHLVWMFGSTEYLVTLADE